MTKPRNFVWYELMTSDLDAAEAFYKAVVGWTAKDASPPGMRYTVMSAGDAMVCGLMTLPEEVRAAGGRPGWIGYVGVDDIEAATASLKQAGGRVYREPTEIPTIGHFSAVADPQGAAFMLFQPMGGAEMPDTDRLPGHVGWRELYAGEWEAAFSFYEAQFGWTKDQAIDMGPMGTYQLFAAGGAAIGGIMTKPPSIPIPVWAYYFNVEEADAAAARVTQHGGQIVMGVHEVPGGMWIVQCMDPQGVMFALVAPKR